MLRALMFMGLVCTSAVAAEEIRVAVAANFSKPLELLSKPFRKISGHSIVPISGSSGTLYAQIRAGAPYDVFLSADQYRPTQLIASGLALPESRLTYAIGRLAVWGPNRTVQGATTLFDPELRRIALANPQLAPFGKAAQQTLQHVDSEGSLRNKLVYGQNIAQVYALTATANAELGFVALSSVIDQQGYWIVPQALHDPILQDAVITRHGSGNGAAAEFMRFLRSETARQIVRQLGYAATGDELPHIRSAPNTDEDTSPQGKQARYPAPPPAA